MPCRINSPYLHNPSRDCIIIGEHIEQRDKDETGIFQNGKLKQDTVQEMNAMYNIGYIYLVMWKGEKDDILLQIRLCHRQLYNKDQKVLILFNEIEKI